MERFTKYKDGIAVLKDELKLKYAIQKLAELEDLEEQALKRAVELYVSREPERKPRERIEVLGLSTRSYNILKKNQINFVDELCQLTEYNLRRLHHMGNQSVTDIIDKLEKHGRKLGE